MKQNYNRHIARVWTTESQNVPGNYKMFKILDSRLFAVLVGRDI